MVQTVKQFIQRAYKIVSPNSPTIPLYGDDMSAGLEILNDLLSSFSGTALMLTIAKEVSFDLLANTSEVTFGDPDYTPTPDVTEGRLANMQNAWIELDGVTYPLTDESRNEFLASYKYDPLAGLPRFAIIYNDDDLTTMRIYPKPSQQYTLKVFGKFELAALGENDTMELLPKYYSRFLKFALAKDLSVYKGRSEAWTPKLEDMLIKAEDDIKSISSINLNINAGDETYLNGAWRVRSGI